jgi:hypothetical protein
MKTINRRLLGLEDCWARVNEEGMSLAALLQARRRRYFAQVRGETAEVRPRARLSDAQNRPETIVGVLQSARRRLAEVHRG